MYASLRFHVGICSLIIVSRLLLKLLADLKQTAEAGGGGGEGGEGGIDSRYQKLAPEHSPFTSSRKIVMLSDMLLINLVPCEVSSAFDALNPNTADVTS